MADNMASKGLRAIFLSRYTKSWSGLQPFAYHWNPYWLYRVL